MRVGVTIYPQFISKDKSLASTLADIKIKNYDFVEIFPHTLGLIMNGTVVEKNLQSVETQLRGVGIDYAVRMPMSVNLRDHVYYSRHFKVAKSILDVAIKLGSKIIVMQSGKTGRLDLEIDAIRELAGIAEKFNIKIALENTFSVRDTLYVVENVGMDNVGFALDVGHAFLSAQGEVEKFLDDVKIGVDNAVLLLVHDNFGKLTPPVEPEDALAYGVGDLHLLPGQGKIPFDKLMRMFDAKVPILLKIKNPDLFARLPTKADLLASMGL